MGSFSYGTATTATVVDAERRYRGGLILPGIRLGLRALSREIPHLPEAPLRAPARLLCTETAESLSAGAVYSAAAATDGLIERIEAELGQPCTAIATGGLAGLVTPHCRKRVTQDSDLLMRGMALMFEMNR